MLQLFHLNTLELDQRIRNELEENPLIEENSEQTDREENTYESAEEINDCSDYKDWDEFDYEDYYSKSSKASKMDILLTKFSAEDFKTGIANDFRSEALEQLHILNLSAEERRVGEFIINNLTGEGFLEDSTDALIDNYMLKYTKIVNAELMDKMISLVKTFEPVGLASSCIRECLLAQLSKMTNRDKKAGLAVKIIKCYYDQLKSGDLEGLSRESEISMADLKNTLNLLARLRLKPVTADNTMLSKQQTIVPDFIVTHQNGGIDIFLYSEKSSMLRVNYQLKSKIERIKNDRKNKATSKELSRKLTAAEWFVNAIRERENVMLQVMKVIVDLQTDYFLAGDELQLRPMILRDVADRVGVDISTVSRITSNKYAQTPFGCILLKDLFNEGIPNKNGEMVNVKKVQEVMEKLICLENKNCPYTDSELAKLLSDRGLKISRRTVTKYRNEIQIPPVKHRHHSISP